MFVVMNINFFTLIRCLNVYKLIVDLVYTTYKMKLKFIEIKCMRIEKIIIDKIIFFFKI